MTNAPLYTVSTHAVHPFCEDAFQVERQFTAVYKANIDEDKAIREARCLAAQYPATLSPVKPNDLLAGRCIATPGVDAVLYKWNAAKHHIPALGFLPLCPGSGPGAGYYCHKNILDKKIEDLQPDDAVRTELQGIVDFWETETTCARFEAALTPEMKREMPAINNLSLKEAASVGHPLVRNTGPHFDYDKLMKKGLPGLYADVQHRKMRAEAANEPVAMYDGLLISLDGIKTCAVALAEHAGLIAHTCIDEQQRLGCMQMRTALLAITKNAPQTLHEAMQLTLLYGVYSATYSWGRMDEYLGDFLVADLEAGRLTEAEALDLCANLWDIINYNGAPYDNRIIIGGKGRRNEQAANRFAHVAIEATRRVCLPAPQLSLRFYTGQDPELYSHALDSIAEGHTFPMLYNDDVNIPSVQKAFQVSEEWAEQYVPYGCGEYVLYKKSFGTPSGVFNHSKILECMLHNNTEPYTGRKTYMPACALLRDIPDFDQLLKMYFQNMDYWIELLADQQALEYKVVADHCAYGLWSLLYDDCLEAGAGMFDGGLAHLGGTLESYGQINVADSLLAIKHLVYEQKKISADELMSALAVNFEGHEHIRQQLLAVPKYGNEHTEADAMAACIHERCCESTAAQAQRIGLASYLIVVINNQANVGLGSQTMASADGRYDWDHLANANNPQPGADKSGVTAFLNSLLSLRTDCHAGTTQNMKFSKETVTKTRTKFEALLAVYFRSGGPQAMINVVGKGDLEAALKEPEKWQNLIVRVGGFSARFVELPPKVQREVLERTLN